MEQALVLSADSWAMTDEKTGEMLKGVSVWFLNSYREDSVESIGWKPAKVGGTKEILEALRGQLPAICEMHYGAKPGAQGKATLTLIGVKVVRQVNLFGNPAIAPDTPKKAA